jgi:hypothetical protein
MEEGEEEKKESIPSEEIAKGASLAEAEEEAPSFLDMTEKQIQEEIEKLTKELEEIKLPLGTVRIRYVNCGNCPACNADRSKGIHGPYLYVYRRENGELHEDYAGKDLAAQAEIRRGMALAKEIRRLNRRLEQLKLRKAPREAKPRPRKAKGKKAKRAKKAKKAKAKRKAKVR